jgi:mitochondrial import receptor subunit TOM40
VGTLQVASTGIVALSYVQKVSEKVSLASDFMYNHMSRDVTSSFGYDYMLRQCRLRGKFDSNGVVAAYLEERLNMGVNFLLSAEVLVVLQFRLTCSILTTVFILPLIIKVSYSQL